MLFVVCCLLFIHLRQAVLYILVSITSKIVQMVLKIEAYRYSKFGYVPFSSYLCSTIRKKW